MTIYNGELIAGGAFWAADGVRCDHIARWDGSLWQPVGSGLNHSAYSLTVYDGELIAGGEFTIAGAATHAVRDSFSRRDFAISVS